MAAAVTPRPTLDLAGRLVQADRGYLDHAAAPLAGRTRRTPG